MDAHRAHADLQDPGPNAQDEPDGLQDPIGGMGFWEMHEEGYSPSDGLKDTVGKAR